VESFKSYIECPSCKAEKCECYSSYDTGDEEIFCPYCEYQVILMHKRDKKGNFIWKRKTKDLADEHIIVKPVLFNDPFAHYSVECKDDTKYVASGQLNTKNDYDNYLSYIDSLSNQKHPMIKMTITSYADGEILKEIIFPKAT